MSPGGVACRARRGQALACPLFLPPRGRRGSGVNGRPQAVARSAMRSTLYTGGTAPYPCAAPLETAAAKPPPSQSLDNTNKEESLCRVMVCGDRIANAVHIGSFWDAAHSTAAKDSC